MKTRTIRLWNWGGEKVRSGIQKFQDWFTVIVSKRRQLNTADDFTFFRIKNVYTITTVSTRTFTCSALILSGILIGNFGYRRLKQQQKIIQYALPLAAIRIHCMALHCIAFDLMLTNDMITLTKRRNQCARIVWYGCALRPDKLDPDGNVHWFLFAFKSSAISWANLCVFLSLFSCRCSMEEGKPSKPFCFGGKKIRWVSSSFFFIYNIFFCSNAIQ